MQRHATSQKWFEIKLIQGYIEALSLCVGYRASRARRRRRCTVDASATRRGDNGGRRTGREGRCDRLPRVFQPTCPVCSRHCVVDVRCASGAQGCSSVQGWRGPWLDDVSGGGRGVFAPCCMQTHDRINVAYNVIKRLSIPHGASCAASTPTLASPASHARLSQARDRGGRSVCNSRSWRVEPPRLRTDSCEPLAAPTPPPPAPPPPPSLRRRPRDRACWHSRAHSREPCSAPSYPRSRAGCEARRRAGGSPPRLQAGLSGRTAAAPAADPNSNLPSVRAVRQVVTAQLLRKGVAAVNGRL